MAKKICFMIISGIVIFMSSCSYSQREESTIRTVAYLMSEKTVAGQNLSVEDTIFAENVTAYFDENGQRILHVYSAPYEKSESAITKTEKGEYSGVGTYIQKLLPDIWSADNPMTINSGANSAGILPTDDGKYKSELKQTVNAFGQSIEAVVYKDVFGNGIDLTYSLTSFGFNTEIVLNKKPETNAF